MELDKFFKILSVEEVVSFGKAQRNRQINKSHVNDFYTIIKNGKFTRNDDGTYLVYGIIPVIVNPITRHILDAQHRVEALKKALENGDIDENARVIVGYWPIEDPEEENRVIIMLNTKSKNWSLEDYITSYAKYNDNYTRLKEFCDTHMLCRKTSKTGKTRYMYRYPAAMITGRGSQDMLTSGGFSFTDEQFAEADKIHNELIIIRSKLNLPMVGTDIEDMACEWYVQRNFISASDIKSLKYIPTSIQNMRNIRNRSDWKFIFSILKDCMEKSSLKLKTAC